MADFFDRLVNPGSRAVLRPRQPGPFERIETLHTEPLENAELAPPLAVSPPPGPTEVLRELRQQLHTTDRVTVVHTEHTSAEQPHPTRPGAAPERPEPVSFRVPEERAPVPESAKPAESPSGTSEPVFQPSPSVLRVESAPVPSERPRTRIEAAAARTRTREPRKRAPERSEPAVQVEIGRLEVKAAQPRQRPLPETPQRRDPAVNLADYLSERANS